MFNRIGTLVGTGFLFALITVPALAGIPGGGPFPGVATAVPEPATISLFGVAAVGAFVARKFWDRK